MQMKQMELLQMAAQANPMMMAGMAGGMGGAPGGMPFWSIKTFVYNQDYN